MPTLAPSNQVLPPHPLPPGYSERLRPQPLMQIDFSIDAEDCHHAVEDLAGELQSHFPPEYLPAVLHVFRGSGEGGRNPPWPTDGKDADIAATPAGPWADGKQKIDADLTRLVLKEVQASDWKGGGPGGDIPLPGGIEVRIVKRESQPKPSTSWGGVSGGGEADGSSSDEDESDPQGEAIGPSLLASMINGGTLRGVGGEPGCRPAAAAEWVAEVNCWGDWASRSAVNAAIDLGGGGHPGVGVEDPGVCSTSSGSGTGSVPYLLSLDLAVLARRLATAAHLMAAAERNALRGRHRQAARHPLLPYLPCHTHMPHSSCDPRSAHLSSLYITLVFISRTFVLSTSSSCPPHIFVTLALRQAVELLQEVLGMCGCPHTFGTLGSAMMSSPLTLQAVLLAPRSAATADGAAEMKECEVAVGLGAMHLFTMRANAALLRAAIDSSSWPEALEVRIRVGSGVERT